MSCSNQGQSPIGVPPQGTPIPPDQFIYDPSSTYKYRAMYAPVRYDQRPRRRQPVTRRTGRGFDHESYDALRRGWVVSRDVKIS